MNWHPNISCSRPPINTVAKITEKWWEGKHPEDPDVSPEVEEVFVVCDPFKPFIVIRNDKHTIVIGLHKRMKVFHI